MNKRELDILKNKKEIRMMAEIEMRQENENEMILEGYPIKFNNETLIGNEEYGFRETIAPNALDEANMKKVPLKYNHADGYLALASTKNGSLEFTIDSVGLHMKARLLNIGAHRDVFEMVRSGLLSECSFAFSLSSNGGSEWLDLDKAIPLRVIKKVDRLYDVSIVDIPAYENTEVYARSFELLEDVRKPVEAAKHEQEDLIRRMNIKIKIMKEKK
jgi:hypothetical protein